MNDYTELKARAEAMIVFDDIPLAPDVILALIADLDEARSGMKHSCAIRLKKEIERLKAENEALRTDAEKWKIVQHCMDQLKADERNASIWSVCSRLLISTAHKLNSAVSTVLEEGVTIGDEEVGDWRVTVERVKEASHD